jgi:hypothetical protein
VPGRTETTVPGGKCDPGDAGVSPTTTSDPDVEFGTARLITDPAGDYYTADVINRGAGAAWVTVTTTCRDHTR